MDHMNPADIDTDRRTGDQGGARDYAVVARAVAYLSQNAREQPSLDDVAAQVGLSPFHFQRLFTRWAGISPKAFLQTLTLEHARYMLRDSASVLDAAYEVGLSGPGRLHDLFVTYEAMSPGAYKSGAAGIEMYYGFHDSPFGVCIAIATGRGLAGLGFVDDHQAPHDMGAGAGGQNRTAALGDMKRRWPNARFSEDPTVTEPHIRAIFGRNTAGRRDLNIVFIGTEFDISVWRTLMKIPQGSATTYSDIARHLGNPKAARAVGSAVGRNPVSFVVPCHRVLRKSGHLGGYHWGLARKQAIIGWEATPFHTE